MIVESLVIPRRKFEAGTGWQLKPEGACRGDVCIPLVDPPAGLTAGPRSGQGDRTTDFPVKVDALAGQMGLALVADQKHAVWSVGPNAVGSRTLVSAEAPALTLPDLQGEPFELASLRGRKVLMVAWSPY